MYECYKKTGMYQKGTNNDVFLWESEKIIIIMVKKLGF